MKAQDTYSPDRLAELFWHGVIRQWLEGNTAPLAEALANRSKPIEGDEIREFLSALAAGKVSRGKGGRPSARLPSAERALVAAVFAKWEELGTKDLAIADVAAGLKITEDQLRGIVDKLRGANFTLENWKKWGRPDFQNT